MLLRFKPAHTLLNGWQWPLKSIGTKQSCATRPIQQILALERQSLLTPEPTTVQTTQRGAARVTITHRQRRK